MTLRPSTPFLLAALLLVAACSKPKEAVIDHFESFAKQPKSPVAALGDDDRALFQRFAAEHDAIARNATPKVVGANMPDKLDGKTVGQVLDIARNYYARKEAALGSHPTLPAKTVERGEYAGAYGAIALGDGPGTAVSQQIQDEVMRSGPRGEPRVFESALEQQTLVRGARTRFMNSQFRYFLADVALIQPAQSGCARPVLAVKLAVENLHQQPVTAIRGKFSFSQAVAGEGAKALETIAGPYDADLVGTVEPGRFAYITAYLEPSQAFDDAMRWDRIAALSAARRKVWFAPEVFYYGNGEQYAQRTGRSPAAREATGCGAAKRVVAAK